MPKKAGLNRPVTVVGAGFSGLAAAFYLSRAGFRVEVIEESERPGGLISTVKTTFGLVETAANGLLNTSRVEELFGLLGLEIVAMKSESRRRFIFRGRARRWPIGIFATLRVLLFALTYLLVRSLVAPRSGESVRDWGARVMGAESTRFLVEPALQGIYAGDPSRLSACVIFARFFSGRRCDTGGLGDVTNWQPKVRGTVTAPEGMGQLMHRLRQKLEGNGVIFTFSKKFPAPTSVPEHPLVVATSAADAARLLEHVDSARAHACDSVEMLPIVTLTAAFRDPPPERLRGFGCLFPSGEGIRALGVLMNTFIFSGRDQRGFSETWIFGGARELDSELLDLCDEEIFELAVENRFRAFDVGGESFGFRVTRWPRALPHFTTALEEALGVMNGLRQNIILTGNFLGEIGLSRILERASRIPAEIANKGEWSE